MLFGFFSFFEDPDHFPSEADAVVMGGQGITVIPRGHGKLRFVDMDDVISVHIAEKSMSTLPSTPQGWLL